MMPAYQRHFCPGLKDEDLKPATLSKELLGDLLRGKLGFNGLIVSDASHMVGLTGRAKRSELVPAPSWQASICSSSTTTSKRTPAT